jgi:AraC family transcriptional regulator, ethanolamine operon transcriptional activator
MREFRTTDPSVTPDASVRAGSFTTEDPCVHEAATVPWDTLVTPLSSGPYKHAITFLTSPGLILYRERFWCRTRIQGLSPPGMFAFAVPLQVHRTARWWGAQFETGLPAMMPGGIHADLSEGHQHLAALIDLRLLRDSIPADLMDAIVSSCRQHMLPISCNTLGCLRAMLNALLASTQADPQALHHPHAIRSMQEDLLAAFRQSLMLPTASPRRVGRAIRQGGLKRAVEFLRSTESSSITIADLCAAAQVTQRTLEYAFRENFGMSPLGFLHLRRYHAARRDLLAADARTVTVGEIAQKNGFYQMGRFAVRYKALFNDSPSQTLERPPEKGDRYLLHPADLALL